MNKGIWSNILRKFRLLYPADYLRFILSKVKNRAGNKRFAVENPGIILPPDYLMYESFRLDYNQYFYGGKETAEWIVGLLAKHVALENKNILDWGCGPGRIVRHLPALLGIAAHIYGTDYNKKSIEWCSASLLGIEFNHNAANAELPYPDNFFGAIYGLSIITHLSEAKHYQWLRELLRILEPGGILLLTSQGSNFRKKLTPAEAETYDNGLIVVRDKVKEGHRTYSAFHPVEFMQSLFAGCDILEHIVPKPVDGSTPQDVWIVRKQKSNLCLSIK